MELDENIVLDIRFAKLLECNCGSNKIGISSNNSHQYSVKIYCKGCDKRVQGRGVSHALDLWYLAQINKEEKED